MRTSEHLIVSAALWAGFFVAPGDVRAKLLELSADDPRAETVREELAKGGPAAALEALEILGQPGDPAPTALGRRRLARIVRQSGDAGSIAPAIALLRDPDPDVRGELYALLVRADLGEAELEPRVEVLVKAALLETEPRLRAQALDELAGLDRDTAFAKLDAILLRLDEPARARAAWLLADRARSRPLLEKRLAAGDSLDPGVLVPALSSLGASLAEKGAATGASAGARGVSPPSIGALPLLLALRSPDPEIRRAAAFGIDTLVRRLFAGADASRFAASMKGLEQRGFEREQGAVLRARAALLVAADPAPALEAARELAATVPPNGTPGDRSTLAASRHLEASALLAAGSLDAAAQPISDEARLLDGLLAERADRESRIEARLHALRLHRRAECELLEVVRLLADVGDGVPPEAAFLSARTIHSL